MTIEEKLQHFNDYAMEDARLQSAEQLDEYQKALEQIFQEHKEEKRRQEELQIKTETEQIIRENNKEFSQEQTKIRREVRQKTEELKDKLFVEIKDRLGRFMDTPAYSEMLVRQMQEALEFAAGQEMILYLDPADSSKKMELEAKVQAPITVSQYSFSGGMRAVIPSKNILIDHSFETKLIEEKERFVFKGGDILG
ncbi:MAG: ATPase [Lachnospiraceae bacterium]|jgi:vacuolar-type H+-ATPase subunit E/Vma4|nr:ATPase [Lachnospiraceae bacterium]MCI8996825.1 ATPase [Lachnospiraceae bacterium]MCI9135166.1 ATPase [Lachnospiraceae bacterium]